jgi:hypothetical protein
MSKVMFIPPPRTGYPVLGYTPSKEEVAAAVGYPNVRVLTVDEALETGSYFGNLVYGKLQLRLRSSDGDAFTKVPAGQNALILENAIVDLNIPKTIVKTPITGRDGTVKEYIQDGDVEVTVSGVLVSEKGSTARPMAAIDALRSVAKLRRALTIDHILLERIGVEALVIESLSLPAHQYMNAQTFVLRCLSDESDLYRSIYLK